CRSQDEVTWSSSTKCLCAVGVHERDSLHRPGPVRCMNLTVVDGGHAFVCQIALLEAIATNKLADIPERLERNALGRKLLDQIIDPAHDTTLSPAIASMLSTPQP